MEAGLTFCSCDACRLLQLEIMNSDKRALKKLVKELTSVKEFTQLRDEVLHSNMGIAKTTLGYESELHELQAVVETQRAELRVAQQALAEKQARQQRIVAVRTLAFYEPLAEPKRILPLCLLCSAIDQTHCWSSSRQQQKTWTTRRTRSPRSSRTATSTWRSSSPPTCLSATCTTSARSSSRECTSTKALKSRARRWQTDRLKLFFWQGRRRRARRRIDRYFVELATDSKDVAG